MKNNLINILLFVILISRIKSSQQETEDKKVFDSKFSNDKILTQAAIDLYLPKYDFQGSHKIKDSYSKIVKYVNDEKKKNENLRDVYVVPEDDIIEDEETYQRRIISGLIRKEINMDESLFALEFKYYVYPSMDEFYVQMFKFIPEEAKIYEYFEVENGIEFEPKKIELNDK
jgi:hypothetical protein